MTENQTDSVEGAGAAHRPDEAPPEWGQPRTKTITWFDPLITAQRLFEMTGRQAVQAIADGVVAPPPIATHFDFAFEVVGDGEVVVSCVPDESAYNPTGLVHGGLICTLLDTVVGCAVHTTLPAQVAYTSIELKVNYLRPVHGHSGALTARGWVVKPGRRVAFAEGTVTDVAGKVLATASGSCLIMPEGH
jgi:uncharacterized protein (TIGR00369 family)